MLCVTRRVSAAIAAVLLTAACSSQPTPKPAPPPGPPKIGVVGLISELKTRGVNQDNWKSYLGTMFSNDPDSVIKTQYEVTVLYDDGTTGTVTVDERPPVQPGQKIRVTGNKIEPIRR